MFDINSQIYIYELKFVVKLPCNSYCAYIFLFNFHKYKL